MTGLSFWNGALIFAVGVLIGATVGGWYVHAHFEHRRMKDAVVNKLRGNRFVELTPQSMTKGSTITVSVPVRRTFTADRDGVVVGVYVDHVTGGIKGLFYAP